MQQQGKNEPSTNATYAEALRQARNVCPEGPDGVDGTRTIYLIVGPDGVATVAMQAESDEDALLKFSCAGASSPFGVELFGTLFKLVAITPEDDVYFFETCATWRDDDEQPAPLPGEDERRSITIRTDTRDGSAETVRRGDLFEGGRGDA